VTPHTKLQVLLVACSKFEWWC